MDNLSIEELIKWGESIKPIVKLPFDGEGYYTPGELWRFCRAKALYRARADHYLSLKNFIK